MSGGYKFHNKENVHFVTFAVVGWVDVFTRNEYRDIFIDSMRFCQERKGLVLHAWCLMTNHVHLAMSALEKNPGDILRDLKKFSSSALIQAIKENPRESRKEWMIPIFQDHGEKNSRNTTHQFWIQDNHPVELFSTPFTDQKINYIHNNPVKAGIVARPEHYLYSSAIDYTGGNGFLHVDLI
jgi:REP element-mobilizing transposase RayT